jgi:hypothetical protein
MNALIGPQKLAVAAIVASLFTAGLAPAQQLAQQPAQATSPSQLKWTPHRAAQGAPVGQEAPGATAPAQPEAAAVATPAPAQPATNPPARLSTLTAPVGPPVSVTLPEGVPPIAAPAPRQASRPAYAPMRPRGEVRGGDWVSPNRIPGAVSKAFDPSNPDGLLNLNVMRTPQGEVLRPTLAPEGRQVVAMERAAGRQPGVPQQSADRLGGGLAPRYTPPRTAARPERYAMNADGIPSVMTRAPAAAPAEKLTAEPAPETITTPAPAADAAGAPDASSVVDSMPLEMGEAVPGDYGTDGAEMAGEGGLLMGEYPTEMHVESFYDDPYECEDEDYLMCHHSGRFCNWLRQFGKPYYGWKWYRDFTASAGVTSFTNSTDLGINGNYGTNEYLNWSAPFWNAFGIGWQVGWRGTQTNFQPATLTVGTTTLEKNARTQNFVTTGFFTRAFEGRGLQGGAVYDYLSDNWFDNVDVAQIRAEVSYVWGYHELGFWSATNIGDQIGLFGPVNRTTGQASTLSQYCGFYRLQFGDANEWKVWGGATQNADGVVGSLIRAPLSRPLAIEGTFTYIIPGRSQSIDIARNGTLQHFSPAAWNLGINLVWYPAGRSRRGLASPYRPLFEVADNGSMIRSLTGSTP